MSTTPCVAVVDTTCSPAAVAGAVGSVVVDAVYRQPLFVPVTFGPCEEGVELFTRPFNANVNASRAVIFITCVLQISASLVHRVEHIVNALVVFVASFPFWVAWTLVVESGALVGAELSGAFAKPVRVASEFDAALKARYDDLSHVILLRSQRSGAWRRVNAAVSRLFIIRRRQPCIAAGL